MNEKYRKSRKDTDNVLPPCPLVFDARCVRRNRTRAARTGTADCFFLAEATARALKTRLADIKPHFPMALASGFFCAQAASEKANRVISLHGFSEKQAFPNTDMRIAADDSLLPFGEKTFDLILSNLTLHSINDLPGALIQIRRALRPEGVFLGTMIGGESLAVLRTCLMQAETSLCGGARPRVHPTADKQQMSALLQRAGFSLPVVDSEKIHVSYKNAWDLMRDLRHMGESNALVNRTRHLTRRSVLSEACHLYQTRYAGKDGRITATFEIIHLIGWSA